MKEISRRARNLKTTAKSPEIVSPPSFTAAANGKGRTRGPSKTTLEQRDLTQKSDIEKQRHSSSTIIQ